MAVCLCISAFAFDAKRKRRIQCGGTKGSNQMLENHQTPHMEAMTTLVDKVRLDAKEVEDLNSKRTIHALHK